MLPNTTDMLQKFAAVALLCVITVGIAAVVGVFAAVAITVANWIL